MYHPPLSPIYPQPSATGQLLAIKPPFKVADQLVVQVEMGRAAGPLADILNAPFENSLVDFLRARGWGTALDARVEAGPTSLLEVWFALTPEGLGKHARGVANGRRVRRADHQPVPAPAADPRLARPGPPDEAGTPCIPPNPQLEVMKLLQLHDPATRLPRALATPELTGDPPKAEHVRYPHTHH